MPFVPPPERRPQGQRLKVPVGGILDTLLKPHARTTIPCTTGNLFSSSTGALKMRSAEVGTDIGEEAEVHPSVYQVITIDGHTQVIVMMHESDVPVCIAPGSLVHQARVIFDSREAAGPFGVGAITTNEIVRAISNAIADRLSDFPAAVGQVGVDVLEPLAGDGHCVQLKDLIAQVRYDKRISKDPKDLACGAQLFGNRPVLALDMPDGLHEFTIHLVRGATPVRQEMRRFTAEATLEATLEIRT